VIHLETKRCIKALYKYSSFLFYSFPNTNPCYRKSLVLGRYGQLRITHKSHIVYRFESFYWSGKTTVSVVDVNGLFKISSFN